MDQLDFLKKAVTNYQSYGWCQRWLKDFEEAKTWFDNNDGEPVLQFLSDTGYRVTVRGTEATLTIGEVQFRRIAGPGTNWCVVCWPDALIGNPDILESKQEVLNLLAIYEGRDSDLLARLRDYRLAAAELGRAQAAFKEHLEESGIFGSAVTEAVETAVLEEGKVDLPQPVYIGD
jgi:hypothetical protein